MGRSDEQGYGGPGDGRGGHDRDNRWWWLKFSVGKGGVGRGIVVWGCVCVGEGKGEDVGLLRMGRLVQRQSNGEFHQEGRRQNPNVQGGKEGCRHIMKDDSSLLWEQGRRS
ncbi:hypothetical protein LINGRAHAP2_LOCUS1885 [Linum grandiflorum]